MKRYTVADLPLTLAAEDDRRMRFIFDRRPAALIGIAGSGLFVLIAIAELRALAWGVALFLGAGACLFLMPIWQHSRRQAELSIDKGTGAVAYVNRIGASSTEWRKSPVELRHVLAAPTENDVIVIHLVPVEGERVSLQVNEWKPGCERRSLELLARTAAATRLPVFVASLALQRKLSGVPGLHVEARPELFRMA